MNRPAVVLYGKGLDKGRIGGALNHFIIISFLFQFRFHPFVSCLQFRDIQCYLS